MSTLRTDTLVDKDHDADSIDVSTLESGSAKAWVSFTGEGTVTINNDYNVNNVGDNGTGDYSINFSTNFANANYVFTGTFDDSWGAGTSCPHVVPQGDQGNTQNGNVCRIYTKDTQNGAADARRAYVSFIGAQ